jgi:hypothetical protein
MEWNAKSPTISPARTWMQYQTPEEAGWSSDKLAEVQQLSNRARSSAVMVIYNGAILTQWAQTNLSNFKGLAMMTKRNKLTPPEI